MWSQSLITLTGQSGLHTHLLKVSPFLDYAGTYVFGDLYWKDEKRWLGQLSQELKQKLYISERQHTKLI